MLKPQRKKKKKKKFATIQRGEERLGEARKSDLPAATRKVEAELRRDELHRDSVGAIDGGKFARYQEFFFSPLKRIYMKKKRVFVIGFFMKWYQFALFFNCSCCR